MTPEKILYTDGRDVTVTDSELKVKNAFYKVNGITKFGLAILRPFRLPGIVLFALGVVVFACGMLNVFSPGTIPGLDTGDGEIPANTVALWAGTAMAVLGILLSVMVKEKYAVRISTAEGDKDAVVSNKKEYISQIVDALGQASTYVRTKTAATYFSKKEYVKP